MIPTLALVRVRRDRGRFSIWAPLFLLWPVLALLILLASPVLFAGCLVMGRNPDDVASAVMGVLWALGGLEIDVDSPGASVLIRFI